MKKTTLVCDNCLQEITAENAAIMRSSMSGSASSKVADLCATCHEALPGREQGRRGRRKKQ